MDVSTETQHRHSLSTSNNNSNGSGEKKTGRSPPVGGAALKPEPWSCNGSGNGEHAQWTLPASAPSATPWSAGFRADSPPLAKIRCGSPTVQRGKVLANRDKESLLEEIINLKKALHEQTQALKMQKIHSVYIESENRKLEKDLEELELHGSMKASRTGNTSRMRSKLQGLKTRLAELQATCESQQEELFSLRRDLRITRIREVEAERDLYAEEIGRLQKLVKRLKALHSRLCNENKQLSRFRDRAAQLDITNQRLESAMVMMQENLNKSNREMLEYRQKANGYKLQTKRSGRKSQEIEEQNMMLEKLVEDERALKRKLENKVNELHVELQNIRSHLMKSGQRFEGVDISDILSLSDYSEDWRSSVAGSMKPPKSYPVLHEQKNYELDIEDEEKYTAEACSQATSKSSAGNREIEIQNVKVQELSQADSPNVACDTVCGVGVLAKGHVVVPKLDLGQVNAESLSGDPGRKCGTNGYESSTYSTTDTEDFGYDSGLEMIMRPRNMSVVNSNVESTNIISLKVITEDDGKGNSSNKEEERNHTTSEGGEKISSSNRGAGEDHIEDSPQVSMEPVHESVVLVMAIGKHEDDNQIVPKSLTSIYSPGEYANLEPSDSPRSHGKLSLNSPTRKLSLGFANRKLSLESATWKTSSESATRKPSLEFGTRKLSLQSATGKFSPESAIVKHSPELATKKLSLQFATGKLSSESATGKHSPEFATRKLSPESAIGKPSPESATGKHSPESATRKLSLQSATGKPSLESATRKPSLQSITKKLSLQFATGKLSPESATGKLSPESATGKLSLESTTRKLSLQFATGKHSLESATGKLSPESATGKLSPESAAGKLLLESATRKLSPESTARKLSSESATGKLSPKSATGKLSPKSATGNAKLSPESATVRLPLESAIGKLSPESPSGNGKLSPESASEKFSLESATGKLSSESATGKLLPESTTGMLSPESATGKLSPEPASRKLPPESTTGKLSPESATRELSSESTAGKHSPESSTREILSESTTGKLSLESATRELLLESTIRRLSSESTTGRLSLKSTTRESSLESDTGDCDSVLTHDSAKNTTYIEENSQGSMDSADEHVWLVTAIGKHEDDDDIIPNSLPMIHSPAENATPELCDSSSSYENLSLKSTPCNLSPESPTGVYDSVLTHENAENASYSLNIDNIQMTLFKNNDGGEERVTIGEQSDSSLPCTSRSSLVSAHNDNAESIDSSSSIQKLGFNEIDAEEEIESIGEHSESPVSITRSSSVAAHENIQNTDCSPNINNGQAMLFNNDDIEEQIDSIKEQPEEGHLHLNPGGNDLETLESISVGTDHPVPCSIEESDQNRSQSLETLESISVGSDHPVPCSIEESDQNRSQSLETLESISVGSDHPVACSTEKSDQNRSQTLETLEITSAASDHLVACSTGETDQNRSQPSSSPHNAVHFLTDEHYERNQCEDQHTAPVVYLGGYD